MKYRRLGSSEFQISEITFGAAAISGEGKGYGFGAISESDSIELVHACIQAGINAFDTAPIYGFNLSEIRLGKAVKHHRDKVFLVSKCGVTWHANGRVNMTNDPETARQMLEQSLRNLSTDYIDLYMVHWPSSTVDIRTTLEPLVKAQSQGKIRFLGLSNTTATDLALAKQVANIVALQSEYNFLTRTSLDLIQLAQKEDMGFMSWGTFDKGILTGRVQASRQYDQFDCRRSAPWWKKTEVVAKLERLAPTIEQLHKNHHTLLQLALSFNLHTAGLSSAICGVRSTQQLTSLLDAYHQLIPRSL